ncbi:MAG: hypothetical protein AAF479_09345 [Pseudomonadota bacterium]
MRHEADLTYEAMDLVAPLRSGLRRMDWRQHAEAIREVTWICDGDYAMAGTLGVSRGHMLAYAAAVPQFAHVLHVCLGVVRKQKSRSWSTTWAWKTTGKMVRTREGPGLRLRPQIRSEPAEAPDVSEDAIVVEVIDELIDRCRKGKDLDVAGLIAARRRERPNGSAGVPDDMRAEDWSAYATEIIKIGQSGGDDYSMAMQLRISRNMLLQYARAIPEFNEALMYARTCARAWWAQAMRLAACKRSGLNAKMVVNGNEWIMRSDDLGQPVDPPCAVKVTRRRARKRRQPTI